MAHSAMTRARRRALQALYQWAINPAPASEILEQFSQEQDLSKVDEDAFRRMVRNTIRDVKDIDLKLAEHVSRPVENLDAMELSVLRLAAHELLQHIEVPFRVVINEAVDLARQFGSDQTPGFVNGVLDKCAKSWRSHEHNAGA
ncbi:MAG: transcription antitermination factor NusB [Lysobacterales bacterium]